MSDNTELKKELASKNAAESLLFESIRERDEQIKALSAAKDKLREDNKYFHCANLVFDNKLNEKKKIESDLTTELEAELSEQRNVTKSFNERLLKNIESFEKLVDKNSNVTLPRYDTTNSSAETSTNHRPDTPSPNVILFHDSLCKPINDTIMSREKVNVTKVWSPTLQQTASEVDDIQTAVDTIVVQALTREVSTLPTADFVALVEDTVTKCLTKSKKVVLSLIVERDDCEKARGLAESANAMLRTKFKGHESVLVCHHDNIRHSRFRKPDKLHLNDDGTSRLANNLKHKIAQSLNIKVVQNPNKPSGNGLDRRFHNNNGWYGNNDHQWNSRTFQNFQNFEEDHGRFS